MQEFDVFFGLSPDVLLLFKLVFLPVDYLVETKGLGFEPFDVALELGDGAVVADVFVRFV